MEKIKQLEEQLSSMIQTQLCNPERVDAKELGEVVDMLKDLSEFCYYKTITEAMEKSEKEQKYYTKPYMEQERMYYKGDMDIRNPIKYRYDDMPYFYDNTRNTYIPDTDPREGRARESRKMYMESKESHKRPEIRMKDLEKYMQDLTTDIVEMVENATPEEKETLKQKIVTLSTKIM